LDAYLDIETTGLSRYDNRITVIGVYRHWGVDGEFIQLWGEQVTPENLLEALDGVQTIYTYNGSGFDLPFIRQAIGVDLNAMFNHHDLMRDCLRHGLKGGLKQVEWRLGIDRETVGMDGFQAVMLWTWYERRGDLEALKKLLKYNKEDVINLLCLREKLASRNTAGITRPRVDWRYNK